MAYIESPVASEGSVGKHGYGSAQSLDSKEGVTGSQRYKLHHMRGASTQAYWDE